MLSLVAQTVKNLPAIWETWVQFLGWEDPLEEGILSRSGGEKGLRGSGAGTLGVPLGGPRPVHFDAVVQKTA